MEAVYSPVVIVIRKLQNTKEDISRKVVQESNNSADLSIPVLRNKNLGMNCTEYGVQSTYSRSHQEPQEQKESDP